MKPSEIMQNKVEKEIEGLKDVGLEVDDETFLILQIKAIHNYLDMQFEAQYGEQLVPCSKEEGDRIINSLFNMKTKTKPAKKAKAIAKAKKVVKKAKKVVRKVSTKK